MFCRVLWLRHGRQPSDSHYAWWGAAISVSWFYCYQLLGRCEYRKQLRQHCFVYYHHCRDHCDDDRHDHCHDDRLSLRWPEDLICLSNSLVVLTMFLFATKVYIYIYIIIQYTWFIVKRVWFGSFVCCSCTGKLLPAQRLKAGLLKAALLGRHVRSWSQKELHDSSVNLGVFLWWFSWANSFVVNTACHFK